MLIAGRNLSKYLNGARLLLVGVAYKKNVSDMRESPAMRLMQLFKEARSNIDFIDPHVPHIPPMREYGVFEGCAALPAGALSKDAFNIIAIGTDHDTIDYARLLELDCPVVDTRNVITKRGLPMTNVRKV